MPTLLSQPAPPVSPRGGPGAPLFDPPPQARPCVPTVHQPPSPCVSAVHQRAGPWCPTVSPAGKPRPPRYTREQAPIPRVHQGASPVSPRYTTQQAPDTPAYHPGRPCTPRSHCRAGPNFSLFCITTGTQAWPGIRGRRGARGRGAPGVSYCTPQGEARANPHRARGSSSSSLGSQHTGVSGIPGPSARGTGSGMGPGVSGYSDSGVQRPWAHSCPRCPRPWGAFSLGAAAGAAGRVPAEACPCSSPLPSPASQLRPTGAAAAAAAAAAATTSSSTSNSSSTNSSSSSSSKHRPPPPTAAAPTPAAAAPPTAAAASRARVLKEGQGAALGLPSTKDFGASFPPEAEERHAPLWPTLGNTRGNPSPSASPGPSPSPSQSLELRR